MPREAAHYVAALRIKGFKSFGKDWVEIDAGSACLVGIVGPNGRWAGGGGDEVSPCGEGGGTGLCGGGGCRWPG